MHVAPFIVLSFLQIQNQKKATKDSYFIPHEEEMHATQLAMFVKYQDKTPFEGLIYMSQVFGEWDLFLLLSISMNKRGLYIIF